MDSSLEIGIVGGGISGLGTAYHLLKTAKRLGRDVKVTIFDKNSSPGGTWSSDSVYDGLMTNNSWTQMLFDDDENSGEKIFKSDSSLGAGPGGFRATGKGMVKVMSAISDQVLSLGATFHHLTDVTSITRNPKDESHLWSITYQTHSQQLQTTTTTTTQTNSFHKIIIATGAFSKPSLPTFALPFVQGNKIPVKEEMMREPLTIHTSHLSDSTVQEALVAVKRRIVVVGASKSALDAAERFSSLGHKVTLVLRNPPYLAPPALPTPTGPTDAVSMVGTRLKAIGIPYPSDPISGMFASGGWYARWYRWWVHGSWFSKWVHGGIIRKSTEGFGRWGQWGDRKLEYMVPKIGLMWSESSIFPGPEKFAHLVQTDKITIVQGSVSNMQRSTTTSSSSNINGYDLTVRSNDGIESQLFATAVIFGSGWQTGSYPFFDDKLLDSLGLPLAITRTLPDREKEYLKLDESNRNRLLSSLRTMRVMPSEWNLEGFSARFGTGKSARFAPYRLYRLMVPLDSLYDRDIAFAGIPTCKANHVLFICQSHWIADYFLDLLPNLPTRKLAQQEISTQTVWAQRLFGPSHGRLGQWLGAMWIEYCSRLCWDMGVPDDGKGWDGVITSSTYDLDRKRRERDEKRV